MSPAYIDRRLPVSHKQALVVQWAQVPLRIAVRISAIITQQEGGQHQLGVTPIPDCTNLASCEVISLNEVDYHSFLQNATVFALPLPKDTLPGAFLQEL